MLQYLPAFILLHVCCTLSIVVVVSGERGEGGELRYSYDKKELLNDPDGAVGAFFGTAVSLNSKYLAVGSIGDGQASFKRSGSVYLYSAKNWQLVQKMAPTEQGANYLFGSSLALCETTSTLVVGSPYAKKTFNGVETNCGVAHVFEIDNFLDLHIEVLQLSPPDGQQYDEYGKAVAVRGDTIAVSAAYHNDGAGAVYMYQKLQNLWNNHSVLSIDADDALYFGHSLAMGENLIAISALHGNDAQERGSVFIFDRASSSAEWKQRVQLFPSRGADGDEYGTSLALSGDTLAVGARYASLSFQKAGAVFLYEMDKASDWSEAAILTATDAQPLGFFGDTVAFGKDILAVGCFGWTGGESSDIVGAVYVFARKSSTVWSESTLLVSSHGSNNDFFSKALSAFGNVIAVGAAGDDLNNMNSGSAFHFNMASRYESSISGEEGSRSNSHAVLFSSIVLLSICCCCYCIGCCPGKKWRRRCCKDWFGVNLGKKKTPLRKRHIRDINDVQHAPLKLDDSQSGYLNSAEDGDDFATFDVRAASQLDGDIEAIPMRDTETAKESLEVHNSQSRTADPRGEDLLVASRNEEDLDSIFL